MEYFTCMEYKYKIKKDIFVGSFSSIHLAKLRNARGGPTVVIKKNSRQDFMINEIKHYKKLNGTRRFLTVFDVCHSEDGYSLVLEMCLCSLAVFLSVPEGLMYHFEKVNFAMQLLEAINEMHWRGIVHKDIKPGNILITFGGVLKIGDLESACEENSKPRCTLRSLRYSPPEVILGIEIVGKAIDLWAAGCVIFEIFTRSLLFPYIRSEDDEVLETTRLFGFASGPFYESLPRYQYYKTLYKNVYTKNHFPKHLKQSLGPGMEREQQLIESLLQVEPSARAPASHLLTTNPLFTTDPNPTMISMTDAVERVMKVTKKRKPRPHPAPAIHWPDPNMASPSSVNHFCTQS